MEVISNEAIIGALRAYGVKPTEAQCEQIRAYSSLLLKWNRSMSLTTVTDERQVLKFHFGESAFALRAVGGIENGRLADVGTGAGFPGIPIRIFSPYLQLFLIEANTKKCAFLSEVVRALNLENVRVLRGTIDERGEFERCFDTITARALGGYDDLQKWARRALSPAGKIALWLGEKDAEKLSASHGWKWDAPRPIPGSKQRVILTGFADPASQQ